MKYFITLFVCFSIIYISTLKAQDSTLTSMRRLSLSQQHYENGITYFNQRSYKKAIGEFEISLSLNASDHLTYYFNGLSYERLGMLTKALLNYTLSISIQPDFTEALFNRAIINYKLKKYEIALEDFGKLLTLPAGETQAIYFRGIKFGENDDDPGFNEVISMSDKDADLYNYMGLCYYQMGKHNLSKIQYAKALKLNPIDDNIWVNAGLTYIAAGDLDSAGILFEKSLTINPYNSVAQLNLSLCNSESSSEQIQQLDRLIHKHREFPLAYAQRAYQYYMAGNYDLAISDYDTAIMLDPDNTSYILERGMLWVKNNGIDKAINDFNRVLNLDKNNDQAWYNLANAYFLNNDYETSIEFYSQAVYLNPSKADLYYNRALAYFYIKELEKACKDMKYAQQLGNSNTEQFIANHCR